MSCSESGETDCTRALERMVFFIDNELADADAATIQRHLDDCAPCVDVYALEHAVKALVARSCAERAPAQLRAKVMVQIRALEVRTFEDRGPA